MIFVLGSINMDLVANVAKMPRAGETLSAESYFVNCGGKGANQAVAIGKLGGQVSMIGVVGDDSYGAPMIENLKSANVDCTHVKVSPGNSGIAMIIVEKGENRIILDKGANYRFTKEMVDDGLNSAAKGDILLMQLEVPLSIVQYALNLAKEKEMITILNPAPAVKLSDSILRNVDIVTPNETETEILTGVMPKGDVEMALSVKNFYRAGVKNVVITLGSRGSVVSHGQNITPVPAIKVKVVDTTSAGDTFVGAMAVKLFEGADIVSAAEFATVASSITITRRGAAVSIPSLKEVQDKIQSMTK